MNTERADHHAAQIAAINVAVIALIQSHPDRVEVAARMSKVSEFLMAQLLNSSAVPDQFVVEFQRHLARLQRHAE